MVFFWCWALDVFGYGLGKLRGDVRPEHAFAMVEVHEYPAIGSRKSFCRSSLDLRNTEKGVRF